MLELKQVPKSEYEKFEFKREKKYEYTEEFSVTSWFEFYNKMYTFSKRLSFENRVERLWEELNYFLKDDPDFKIEEISGNTMYIRCKRIEAFHDIPIMGRIFGRIMFTNCVLNINKKSQLAEEPKDDEKIYDFKIFLDKGLFYQGSIIVGRR
ncbi:MAG: hypothetical protein ACTSQI_19635 [Candidatus Helarchaeota archaeon]